MENSKIFELPRRNRQIGDLLLEAMIAGALNSDHAKDPDRPDDPGTLERFMAKIANDDPVRYMQMLISKLAIEHGL
jgi:hypothetical protein